MKGCILYDNRLFIPQRMRNSVLKLFHKNHSGIVATKSMVRSLVWYPKIDVDVERMIKECALCQKQYTKPVQVYVQWPKPPHPWYRLHIDHFFFENHIFLIVVDPLTKYVECEIVKSTSMRDTINALQIVFSRSGIPFVIVSDNASSFVGTDIQQFFRANGIKHITSPPYSPSSNGSAEKYVDTVKRMLRKCDPTLPINVRLAKVLFHYRTIPHSVTGIPPCVALNKRKYVTALDKINPLNVFDDSKCVDSSKINNFKVGDSVLALNLRGGDKWLKGIITEKLAINVFNVFVSELEITWKRHSNQLRKLHNNVVAGNTDDDDWPILLFPNADSSAHETLQPQAAAVATEMTQPDQAATQVQQPLRRSTRTPRPPQRYGFED